MRRAGNNIAGFILEKRSKDYAEIVFILVDKRFQNKGIGSGLIAEMVSDSRVITYVKFDANNRRLVNFYRRNGFASLKLIKQKGNILYELWEKPPLSK